MKHKVILDPSFRRLENIFTKEDLARLYAVADICWSKNEVMPQEEIEKVRHEVIAIITGSYRHGDVDRFPKLKAILEVGGGFPSVEALDYAKCFSKGIRVLSCAPAFGPAVAEMGLALALACSRQVAWTDAAFRHNEKVKGPASYFPSMEKTYGKPMSYWFALVNGKTGMKHMEIVNWLKSEHSMGHGHANAVVGYCLANKKA
jgi:phosphoglycerate dehydrogenase-like enzyme